VVCKEATYPPLRPIGYDAPLRRRWDKLRRNCVFIAQTEMAREALINSGIGPERVYGLPNGVSIPPKTATPAARRTVLYVGNFSQGAPWKAFDVLFDAWAEVHRRDAAARLILVGGGDSASWGRYADRLGCGTSVEFAGRVDDVDAHYRQAALFALPSRVEGMSNALLEAQSWGLPCVVSDIPGNTAVVTDAVNGLVVPVGDAHTLADAIVRLLLDPALRERLGRNAREKAAAEYDITRVTDRLIDIYRHILAPVGREQA
jgi:glycosyltransferase involved in cell wall biosynthesis